MVRKRSGPSPVWRTLLCCAGLLLSACATNGGGSANDPLEPLNRKVMVFNDKADEYFLKPVAKGYQAAVPLPARVGVSNFFSNLSDVWTAFNNLLQGKPGNALSDSGRFLLNSTVGIFGVFDVASEAGLEKHDEDFGQTLGVWGVGPGPFLELPLLGPRTLRDTGSLFVDSYGDLVSYPESVATRNQLRFLRLIDTRVSLLGTEKTLDEAATDKYVFIRDFYLRKREADINDGRRPKREEIEP